MREIIEINRNQIEELINSDIYSCSIIDVREKEEFVDFNIGGLNIPAHEVTGKIEFLEKFEKLIIVCSNGMRSNIMARVLLKKLKNPQIMHLTEGIF